MIRETTATSKIIRNSLFSVCFSLVHVGGGGRSDHSHSHICLKESGPSNDVPVSQSLTRGDGACDAHQSAYAPSPYLCLSPSPSLFLCPYLCLSPSPSLFLCPSPSLYPYLSLSLSLYPCLSPPSLCSLGRSNPCVPWTWSLLLTCRGAVHVLS